MDSRHQYRILLTAIVLTFVLAVLVLFFESDQLERAIVAFGGTTGLGALGAGGIGVARNWRGQKEPPPDTNSPDG